MLELIPSWGDDEMVPFSWIMPRSELPWKYFFLPKQQDFLDECPMFLPKSLHNSVEFHGEWHHLRYHLHQCQSPQSLHCHPHLSLCPLLKWKMICMISKDSVTCILTSQKQSNQCCIFLESITKCNGASHPNHIFCVSTSLLNKKAYLFSSIQTFQMKCFQKSVCLQSITQNLEPIIRKVIFYQHQAWILHESFLILLCFFRLLKLSIVTELFIFRPSHNAATPSFPRLLSASLMSW